MQILYNPVAHATHINNEANQRDPLARPPCGIVHFFFPRQENKEEKNRRRKACSKKQPLSATELKEIESFKKNPVLIALAEGRLPDERPNYEYFAQILALNDQIAIRPKRCWIFVSHPNVTVRGDGSGYLTHTGDRLDRTEYPHLERNLEKEKWAKEEQHIFKGSLLHEFTKEIRQVESSTVREVSRGWETSFPELHERLEAIIAADSRCDYLHMNVALELKEKRGFPNQSDFNSWIEINIEQPQLLSHRWKVETKLVRPAELSFVSEKSPPQTYYETGAEIAIQYQHNPGCEAHRNVAVGGHHGHHHQCACINSARGRREWVMVPFPADAWARTLTNAAEYPAHPFTGGRRGTSRRTAAPFKREDPSISDDNDDTDGTSSSTRSSPIASRNRDRDSDSGQPTQMELIPQIAMLQEIWSCPPESQADQDGTAHAHQGQTQPQWTRRAVILWTFETIHSLDNDGKLLTAQTGKTSWRFLTVLDPTSPYHQQKALLSSSDAAAAGQIMGPNRHSHSAAHAAHAASASLSIQPNYPGVSHGMGMGMGVAEAAFIPSPISSGLGNAHNTLMSPASGYQHHHLQNAAAAGLNADLYNNTAAASSAATTSAAWTGGTGTGTDTRSSFSSVGSGATHLSSAAAAAAAAATGYDAQFQMMLEHSMRGSGSGHGAGQRLGSTSHSVHSGLETPPPSATMSNSYTHNFDAVAGGVGSQQQQQQQQHYAAAANNQQHSGHHAHTGLSSHASHRHAHAHAHHPPQPSLNDLAAVTDPFLTATYGPSTTTPSTWGSSTSGLDPSWSAASAGYAAAGSSSNTQQWGSRTSSSSQHLHPQTAAASAVSHHGSNPVSRAGSISHQYHQPAHHHQSQPQQQQQQQQQWQAADDQDLWTPATSTSADAHWPVTTADQQQQDHHQSQSQSQHQQHQQQHHYPRQQDHYHHSHPGQNQHRSITSHSPEGSQQHLSQEWDEIVASVNGSQGPALAEEVHMGNDYYHPQPHTLARGVKRTRSVADLGDDEDEDDDEDGGEGEGGGDDDNDEDYED